MITTYRHHPFRLRYISKPGKMLRPQILLMPILHKVPIIHKKIRGPLRHMLPHLRFFPRIFPLARIPHDNKRYRTTRPRRCFYRAILHRIPCSRLIRINSIRLKSRNTNLMIFRWRLLLHQIVQRPIHAIRNLSN